MASAAHLAVFAALIDLENDANAFDALFRALAAVLGFDRALVLADTDGAAYCVAAQPADLAGRRWPGRTLRDAMTVRAFAPAAAPPRKTTCSQPSPTAARRSRFRSASVGALPCSCCCARRPPWATTKATSRSPVTTPRSHSLP